VLIVARPKATVATGSYRHVAQLLSPPSDRTPVHRTAPRFATPPPCVLPTYPLPEHIIEVKCSFSSAQALHSPSPPHLCSSFYRHCVAHWSNQTGHSSSTSHQRHPPQVKLGQDKARDRKPSHRSGFFLRRGHLLIDRLSLAPFAPDSASPSAALVPRASTNHRLPPATPGLASHHRFSPAMVHRCGQHR
jgi:hypothetical protein